MKRAVRCCAVALIGALLLGGCVGSRELKELSLVVGMGVDQNEQSPQLVDVTAQIVKVAQIGTGQSDQGASSTNAYWDLTSSGSSVFDAVREFTHLTHNKLYLAHAELIVFGRKLAEEGLENDIDFLMRDEEVRPGIPVAVADGTAKDLLNVPSAVDKMPSENLRIILQQQGLTSEGRSTALLDVVNSLLSNTSAQRLPLLRVTDNNGSPTVTVSGTAVLKHGHMVGQLDGEESRGVEWITGKVKTGVVNIPMQGSVMSFEILRATASLKPVLKDGMPHMNANIYMECVLDDQTGKQDVT